MATESAALSTAPRPWLLIILGLVVVAWVGSRMFSSGPTAPAVTNPGPRPAAGANGDHPKPADLDVQIERLSEQPSALSDAARNPFRFQPKPEPMPPVDTRPRGPVEPTTPPGPTGPPPPPPPPRISETIKFIGIVETERGKIGAFSDCKATFPGREGEIIEGRYRVVRIGIESAVLEHLDGKGRETLPLNGQACVQR